MSKTILLVRVARFFLTQYTKAVENVPDCHKIYQMAIEYTKWPNFSVSKPSKIYPNWDFWFENIASGNPASRRKWDFL
jgi:hypothetical protein